MKKVKQSFRMPVIFLAGASVFACAPFFGDEPSWQPAPGTRIVQADLRPSAGYYENAVAAINARRYALALDYLQAARTQKPDDVRVLTAFGVIYDKLGRFDLSTRYYAQAAALDPRSIIIAQDVDYSRRLQNLISPQSAPMVAEAAPPAPTGGTWPRSVDTPQPVIAAVPLNTVLANAMISPADLVLPAPGFTARSESIRQPVVAAVPMNTVLAGATIPPIDRVSTMANFNARSESISQPVIATVPLNTVLASATIPPIDRVSTPVSFKAPRSVDIGQPVIAAVPMNTPPATTMILPVDRVATVAGIKTQPKSVVSVVSAGRGVFLTGHPLMLINGSGHSDAVDLVGRHLSGLGWSVAKSAEVRKAAEPQTTIFYEQSMITVAKALAHTLALPTRLTASGDIKGLQLILGSDISSFDSKGTPPRSQRKQVALAANSKSRE